MLLKLQLTPDKNKNSPNRWSINYGSQQVYKYILKLHDCVLDTNKITRTLKTSPFYGDLELRMFSSDSFLLYVININISLTARSHRDQTPEIWCLSRYPWQPCLCLRPFPWRSAVRRSCPGSHSARFSSRWPSRHVTLVHQLKKNYTTTLGKKHFQHTDRIL